MVWGLLGAGGRRDPPSGPGRDLSAKTGGIRTYWEADPSHLDPQMQVPVPSPSLFLGRF